MWTLGIGNIEQTKKLHCVVVAWLLGRAGGCKERPGAVGMSWLGMKWSSNRAPSSISTSTELHLESVKGTLPDSFFLQ